MLRFALLVFLLANAGYLAWSQGWMGTLGWLPQEQSEPYRLQQQVRPEVLSIVTAAPEAQVRPASPTPAPEALLPQLLAAAQPALTEPDLLAGGPQEEVLPQSTICLQTDAMDQAQLQKLQNTLQQSEFPANSWEVLTTTITARWMVYMGKFANEAALDKRRVELRNRKIAYDRAGGALEPGLSLGRFSSEEAATRELGNMLNQGIRGARVVQERAAQNLYVLRFGQVTAAQQTRLQHLKNAFQGRALRTCSN